MGYHRAGFEVVGVDILPQPHYPFEFVQMDALDFMRRELEPWAWNSRRFAVIHASPPCQAYTNAQRIRGRRHPDLLEPTRFLVQMSGRPYVIENVRGAPLRNAFVLEGQMFDGLGTVRPRYFEVNWPINPPVLWSPPPRQAKMGRRPKPSEWIQVVGHFTDVARARKAMGIDWMTRDELKEAIPPAYTEWIGRQLLAVLERAA